jgi:hypothetical protein
MEIVYHNDLIRTITVCQEIIVGKTMRGIKSKTLELLNKMIKNRKVLKIQIRMMYREENNDYRRIKARTSTP